MKTGIGEEGLGTGGPRSLQAVSGDEGPGTRIEMPRPRPALKLRRCAAMGCQNLVAQGYCAECAQDTWRTGRLVDYFPPVPGTVLAKQRAAAAARERRGERLALLGCVLLLACFVWATRSWWLEWLHMWAAGR